jgi:hypothetical protein
MNTTSTIIKSLILPLIIKLSKGDVSSLPDDFWHQFATNFIYYEIDAAPVYAALYQLELENPEDVFEKLPQVYSSFIIELAEEYVLGNQSEITTKLLETKNETFLKEVAFFNTMKAVIIKTERNQLRKDLPQAYDRLVFELDEETLLQVAKKKSREDLRAKFEQWDGELVESKKYPDVIKFSLSEEKKSDLDSNEIESIFRDEEFVTNSTKSKGKVITLSWIKYAAVACLVLGLGVWFYTNPGQENILQNEVVIAPGNQDSPSNSTITPIIPSEALAEVVSVTKNASIISSDHGFASTNIKITENNQKARKESIEKAIEKYRQMLEKEFPENKVGVSSIIKVLESKINSLQNELALMKEREKQYVFDGKALILYVSAAAKENSIMFLEDTFYLKKDKDYFKLNVAEQPQLYEKVSNSGVLNALDKIYNGY